MDLGSPRTARNCSTRLSEVQRQRSHAVWPFRPSARRCSVRKKRGTGHLSGSGTHSFCSVCAYRHGPYTGTYHGPNCGVRSQERPEASPLAVAGRAGQSDMTGQCRRPRRIEAQTTRTADAAASTPLRRPGEAFVRGTNQVINQPESGAQTRRNPELLRYAATC